MPPPALYSEFNIMNSIATYVAAQLLAAGYVVYWQARDLLQVGASTWYQQYSTKSALYLADSGFLTLLQGKKGIVTLRQALPADPVFVARPTLDGSVLPPDAVATPALSIEIGPSQPIGHYELGTTLKWRSRHLVIDGYTRTQDEQARFKDYLSLWFEPDIPLSIYNHDAGTGTLIDTLLPLDGRVDAATVIDRADAVTYQVLLNARLEYIA